MSRKGDWIQVRSGGQFWPLDPRPEEIHIEDVAHALSNQCRYSGHVKRYYSVAQHSVLVSRIVCDLGGSLHAQLWGLLHDASEAYLVDLASPIKRQEDFSKVYLDAEKGIMDAVKVRFALIGEEPEAIKRADKMMLATEVDRLMQPRVQQWGRWLGETPRWGGVWSPVDPTKAKRMFLRRYYELMGESNNA